jgi:dTDP-4-amino-4,6-dideoxygalactose transaminase
MIPLARPFLGKEEVAAVKRVIFSRWVTQGPKVHEFERAFASYVGAKYACAVSSCTAALHLALLVAGVRPGDVVITVSHSFIATANSIRHAGAEPVFVDIDPDNYNMSPSSLEICLLRDCITINGRLYYKNASKIAKYGSPLSYYSKINPSYSKYGFGQVKAIVPVHQMGIPCDISSILYISNKYGLPVIEDAACAVGSELLYKKRWEKVGKPHGFAACFSFHPRKIMTTGEGGMITTHNKNIDSKLRLLRQHGMNISDVKRHNINKIINEKYVAAGFNYRMTDIQAAVGIEQLKKLPAMIEERHKIASLYNNLLRNNVPWMQPFLPNQFIKPNWQSYPVKIVDRNKGFQKIIMRTLLNNGIATKRGIMNAHLEPVYNQFHYSLPESERAQDNVILLPFYNGIREKDISKVINLLKTLNNIII